MLETGTIVAGYRIDSFRAQGGMGVVYRATQTALDRPVALKLIAPELARDPQFRERFQRESRLAAQIEHPNVIPIYEAGEANGQLFIAMRFIDGSDLSKEISRHGTIEPPRAARIVAQVADALDAAHKRGLVHRDVKPANVLLADGHAYLTDFGLVKDLGSGSGAMTTTGQWVGTPDYVAPEQFKGLPIDARVDIYALGCVLFNALTGRVPFPRDQAVAKLWAHSEEMPPRPSDFVPEVPTALDEVVARAMAKAPGDRFASAGDLGRAAVAAAEGRSAPADAGTVARGDAAPGAATVDASLRGAGGGGGGADGGVTVPSGGTPGGSPGRRPSAAVIAAVVAALVVAGIAIALLAGGGDDPKPGPGPTGGGGGDAPHGPEIAKKIEVGGQLRDITAGGGSAWAIGRGGTVVKVDAKSAKVASETRPNSGGATIAYGHGAVFATMRAQGSKLSSLVKIDPKSDQVLETKLVPQAALGIAIGPESVWVTFNRDGQVRHFSPADLSEPAAPAFVKKGPFGIAIAERQVWVTQAGAGPGRENPGGGLLSTFLPPEELSPDADTVFPPRGIDVGEKPWVASYAGGAIWTASPYNQITRVDPRRRETLTIHPDEIFSPSDIVGDKNRVYIAGWKTLGNRTTHQFVQRLDPVTGRPIGKAVDLGEAEDNYGPVSLALADGHLWAAADGDIYKFDL